ncbi:hypothetical protein HA466_0081470 [Hirschfeldia incana]|nr:hypothetical protein HA466_0081470 [Hirschfeldia incana]
MWRFPCRLGLCTDARLRFCVYRFLGSSRRHQQRREDEAELIQKLTDDIWDKLSVSGFNGLVGMHLHMDSMSDLLILESEFKEVRQIGICGSVGIGKTTLARYLYQQISPYFHTLLFLENVGRISEDHGSSRLQEELLWEHIQRSSKEGINVTKASLQNSKVLLIVDGVDDNEQIEGIQKVATWFGEMSRVIFTCSDKSLILACGIEHLYHVEPMRFSETLRLFCTHAFKQIRPPIGYEKLSDRAINLADGIPLVTAAVGSELFGRSKEEWEAVLSRYERLSDEGTVGKEKGGSGLEDISKVSGRSLEEWKMVLSKYEQSSNESTIGTEISVIDDKDKSLTWNSTTFNYVGMDCHIQAVCGLLMQLESDNGTPVVGIWGVGGVGKTTLARCVYEKIMPHFHTHVFLENVGKIYQDHGSSRIHEELLLENMQRSSKNGSDVTKARLRNRKVLLIVDGVDGKEQVDDVHKVVMWFGAGSRVILTTRDKNLVAENGVNHVYELHCLKVHEALQLFYQFAFKQQAPSTHFKQLSVRAVQLAGRIPLALEVLASFLRGKDENDWKTVLQNLERQQDEDMVEVAEESDGDAIRNHCVCM